MLITFFRACIGDIQETETIMPVSLKLDKHLNKLRLFDELAITQAVQSICTRPGRVLIKEKYRPNDKRHVPVK